MTFTLVRQINGECWVYRDQDGHLWHLGFPLQDLRASR